MASDIVASEQIRAATRLTLTLLQLGGCGDPPDVAQVKATFATVYKVIKDSE